MKAFRLKGLDHVALRVRDLAAMVGFYRRVLGCAIARKRPDLGMIHLRAGATMIDLIDLKGKLGRNGGAGPKRRLSQGGRNVDHFCLQIEPFDEATIRRHLRRHKVAVGDVAQRYGADGIGPSIYLTDPEGNVVELKGPVDVPAA